MDGVINVYKPCGITSFDVIRKIRKITGMKKIGHTGTLDPAACGVLPICFGKATKIIDYIMENRKSYKAHLKLGTITDTYDREGKVITEQEVCCSEEQVKEVIAQFIGEIEQVPPMYSALKINGKRLYELAREGIEVERKPRKVSIYDIKIIDIALPDVFFEVTCSKGTYIRSLCFDIGENLKCGGAMWGLERTATGTFTKEKSVHLDELNGENIKEYLVSIEEALKCFTSIVIEDKYEKMILNGVPIYDPKVLAQLENDKLYRVYLKERFLGLGKKEKGHLKMSKLLI